MGPLEILFKESTAVMCPSAEALLTRQIMRKWTALQALIPESVLGEQACTFLSIPVSTKKNMDPCYRTHYHEPGHFLEH